MKHLFDKAIARLYKNSAVILLNPSSVALSPQTDPHLIADQNLCPNLQKPAESP